MGMQELDVPLDRDLFFRKIIRSFAASLEATVGADEAAGYVAVVGSEIGEWIEAEYSKSAGRDSFDPQQIAELLVDLKRRIGGAFHIISFSDEQILLGNSECPFGQLADGQPALCQMTSNVFGRIAANQLGYARVVLQETIARGDGQCRIAINLKADDDDDDDSHEFFKIDQPLI